MEKQHIGKASDHLANERTFLAWIRTSIGIMGFGFVVVKFSLFVRQISIVLSQDKSVPAIAFPQKGYSSKIGILLVAIGMLTSLFAYLNYRKTRQQLDSDTYSSASPLITILTACIVCISALLLWYLV